MSCPTVHEGACHRDYPAKHSRHIERKMRELHQLGIVRLSLVPTDDMEADLFTKPLPDKTFLKHRETVMGARNYGSPGLTTEPGGC